MLQNMFAITQILKHKSEQLQTNWRIVLRHFRDTLQTSNGEQLIHILHCGMQNKVGCMFIKEAL